MVRRDGWVKHTSCAAGSIPDPVKESWPMNLSVITGRFLSETEPSANGLLGMALSDNDYQYRSLLLRYLVLLHLSILQRKKVCGYELPRC